MAVSEDMGRSWILISGAWDTLSGPTSALALNRGNNQIWYGGQNAIEQMVLRRVDLASGLTTEFSGVVLDPQDSGVIYTASWIKDFDNPQPFVLEMSRDGGRNWNMHVLDEPGLFGGAWSLLAVLENDKTVLYAGLLRGGIVKVLFADGEDEQLPQ